MRRFVLIGSLCWLSLAPAHAWHAASDSLEAARVSEIDAARGRLRQAGLLDPLGQLHAEERFARARVAALEARLADYDRVNRFRTGNALPVTMQQARLALLREQRLLSDIESAQIAYRGRWRQRVLIAEDPRRRQRPGR